MAEEFIQLSPEIKYKTLKDGIGGTPVQHQEVYCKNKYLLTFYFGTKDGEFISGSNHTATRYVVGRDWLDESIQLLLNNMNMGQRLLAHVEFVNQKPLEYEIEVIRFGNILNMPWQLEGDERFTNSTQLKQEANEHIKKQVNYRKLFINDKEYKDAMGKYQSGLRMLNGEIGMREQELQKQLRSNLTLSLLKLGEFEACVKEASIVLQSDPQNAKILHRRGIANAEIGDFELARSDILEALKYDPNNKELNKELENISTKSKKIKDKQSAIYKKMLFGD